jgi:esterase/lipase superfamily enzyme/TRAP-type C4-dicarboxylate transport system substrate-binding protein
MLWRSLAILAASIIFCDPCQSAEPIIIRFAMPFALPAPAKTVVSEFLSAINKRIDGVGRVVAEQVGPNPLLALRSGVVDLAAVPSSRLGASKTRGIVVFDLPFILNDLTETARLQQGAIGEAILSSTTNEGLVGLGYWNIAMHRLLGTQVRSAESLKGKKILTYSSAETKKTLLALGGVPVTVHAAEVYSAMQAGIVDAIDTTPNFILTSKLYETKSNLVEPALRPQVLVVVAPDAFWSRLPYRIQSAISDQVRASSLQLNRAVSESDSASLRLLKERGMQTVSWSPADIRKIRLDVQSTVNADKKLQTDKLIAVALNTVEQDQEHRLPNNQPLDPTRFLGGHRTLFFATDRNAESSPDPNFRFGSGRSNLTYGTVGIDLGQPRPTGGQSNGAKITNIQQFMGAPDFAAALAASLKRAEMKEVLVYVHGFYNNFNDATESAAQLVDDLKFKGAPIVFSWPSDGTAPRYPHDEQESVTSRNSLVSFLTTLKGVPGLGRIHILAHSMGGRVVGNALEWISTLPAPQRPPLSDVIFAAPDVYVTRFRQMMDTFPASAKQVTLYASKADQALICSQLFHDGARAGQAGHDMIVDPHIQTIDVSNAETESFMARIAALSPATKLVYWLLVDSCRSGHSYVTRNFSIINDLHGLIIGHEDPDARILLQRRPLGRYHYWEMRRVAR